MRRGHRECCREYAPCRDASFVGAFWVIKCFIPDYAALPVSPEQSESHVKRSYKRSHPRHQARTCNSRTEPGTQRRRRAAGYPLRTLSWKSPMAPRTAVLPLPFGSHATPNPPPRIARSISSKLAATITAVQLRRWFSGLKNERDSKSKDFLNRRRLLCAHLICDNLQKFVHVVAHCTAGGVDHNMFAWPRFVFA